MERYLIDTCVLSDYFSDKLPKHTEAIIVDIINQKPNISVITAIELLSWVNPDKGKETEIRNFVADANVMPLTIEIAEKCVKIRRGKTVKLPDAIIAAPAIQNGLILITKDPGFKSISDLDVFNPSDSIM